MAKFYKILFFNILILSSLIAISSYSWFSMWLGLEINLLSIIPLFNSNKNYFPSEAALKYYVTQSMASTIILFSVLNMSNSKEMILSTDYFNQIIFNSSIFIKMGAAPFHFWFPEISEGLNWVSNLILLTWQKLAPFSIISYVIENSSFFILVILSSLMIGGFLGMNQVSLRKILTFSSINHIGWMLSSMLISNSFWMVYFLIYTFISITLIWGFKNWNTFYLHQMFNFNNTEKSVNLMFFLMFLSLGGLPPFLGFFPKWITIYGLVTYNLSLLSILMIILTLLTLFYYLRSIFMFTTLVSSETILQKSKLNKMTISVLNNLNLTSLLLIPLLFNFI
uniref:NADH-ubiquinone oxidoreductase chain 2 n=1 Tax=Cucujoidea sp. 21 KM-2017 TaxID=2219358 RepID=A0A346RGE1_9CUCU|nr:NADH dehydrogenase subunit 2 [Cucujoidea sp. 21 KM-2017]